MAQEFSNNASALLITDTGSGDTSITLAPGDGDRFPQPDVGNDDSFALVTLEDINGNFEICKMTERSGDILTVLRAQENTSALGFATGSRCESRLTAGSLEQFSQKGDVNFKGQGLIDTDGINIWHQTDPNTYGKFVLRYWTNLAGNQVCEFEGPEIAGTVWATSVTGTDGGKRNIALGLSIDPESGGTVGFRVPGNLKFQHRTRFREQMGTWVKWDTDESGFNQYHIEPQAPVQTAGYKFTCRDDQATYDTGFNISGEMFCNHKISVHHFNQGLNRHFEILHTENPFQSQHDVIYYNTTHNQSGINEDADVRQLSQWFECREKVVETGQDTVWTPRIIVLNPRGMIQVPEGQEPEEPTELTTKKYVDEEITAALSGESVAIVASSVYGRTRLWNSDTGATGGATIYTLVGGGKWTDFLTIEVTAFHATDGIYGTVSIDTQTLVDKGYNAEWMVMGDPTGGDANSSIRFEPKSLTTFTVGEQGTEDFRVTRIIGMFPTT